MKLINFKEIMTKQRTAHKGSFFFMSRNAFHPHALAKSLLKHR